LEGGSLLEKGPFLKPWPHFLGDFPALEKSPRIKIPNKWGKFFKVGVFQDKIPLFLPRFYHWMERRLQRWDAKSGY